MSCLSGPGANVKRGGKDGGASLSALRPPGLIWWRSPSPSRQPTGAKDEGGNRSEHHSYFLSEPRPAEQRPAQQDGEIHRRGESDHHREKGNGSVS